MTEYGFTPEELRDDHSAPFRHDCGHMVVTWPETGVLEDANDDGPMGTEHECSRTDDIPDSVAPTLAELLAKVNALIPTEPDHTSEPGEAPGWPSPARDRVRQLEQDVDREIVERGTIAAPRRANSSHANCSHPATKAARAKCRRDRSR